MTRRRDEMAQKDKKKDSTIKLSNTNENTDEKFFMSTFR